MNGTHRVNKLIGKDVANCKSICLTCLSLCFQSPVFPVPSKQPETGNRRKQQDPNTSSMYV